MTATVEVGTRPTALAVTDDAVWVGCRHDASIVRVGLPLTPR